VFIVDCPPFDRMFKMVLIFTECLKWSSFSQFVFYLVFSVTPFKSLTEHCTGGTVCIRMCYVYCTGVVQCSVNDFNGVTGKDQIKHELRK